MKTVRTLQPGNRDGIRRTGIAVGLATLLVAAIPVVTAGSGITYLATLFTIVYLRAAQAIGIPLMLLAFPIGFFFLLFDLLEGVLWLLGKGVLQPDFMPCRWLKLERP